MNYNEYLQSLVCSNYQHYDPYQSQYYTRSSSPDQRIESEAEELKESLLLIKQSVAGEKEDEMFYDALIAMAPNSEQKEIIKSIRDDEKKHNKILRKIYFQITGVNLPADTYSPEQKIMGTYEQELEKALMGELKAVTRYQNVLKGMTTLNHRNLIIEILTDELRHASKYNFLITKNLK